MTVTFQTVMQGGGIMNTVC